MLDLIGYYASIQEQWYWIVLSMPFLPEWESDKNVTCLAFPFSGYELFGKALCGITSLSSWTSTIPGVYHTSF